MIAVKVLSYLLYSLFLGITLFVGIRVSRSYRNIGYYNEKVFPLYSTFDIEEPSKYKDKEFLNKTISAFKGYYSENHIYEYSNNDPLKGLIINLKIYPFYRTVAKNGVGYVIHIDKLEYEGYDLMGRTRANPSPREYHVKYPVFMDFSFSNSNQMAKYEKVLLDPFKINYFTNDDLGNTTSNKNELLGIKFYINKDNPLLILTNERSEFFNVSSKVKKTDLDLNESKYTLNINYKKPTAEDINNYKINYEIVNYGKHQNVMTLTILIIIFIFIIVGYFAFIHGYIVKYYKEKKGIYT